MMATFTKNLILSWDDVQRDARRLATQLATHPPFNGVIAIPRGGLVPAAVLARELDIHLIETLCIVSYDHQDRGQPNVLKGVESAGDGSGWLLVDDLVDTGGTAEVARRLLPGAHFACLYAKPEGRPYANDFIAEVDQDCWVHFPWDTDRLYVAPLVDAPNVDAAS